MRLPLFGLSLALLLAMPSTALTADPLPVSSGQCSPTGTPWVPSSGGVMCGDLGFETDRGVAFTHGRLASSDADHLTFGGHDVCLNQTGGCTGPPGPQGVPGPQGPPGPPGTNGTPSVFVHVLDGSGGGLLGSTSCPSPLLAIPLTLPRSGTLAASLVLQAQETWTNNNFQWYLQLRLDDPCGPPMAQAQFTPPVITTGGSSYSLARTVAIAGAAPVGAGSHTAYLVGAADPALRIGVSNPQGTLTLVTTEGTI